MRRTIAVNDVQRRTVIGCAGMSIKQRLRNLAHDARHLRRRKPLVVAFTGIAQYPHIGTMDVFHGNVPVVIDFADLINVHNVRMFQTNRNIAFILEHRHKALIFRIGRKNALDGYVYLRHPRICIASLVNLSHTADGDLTKQKVISKWFRLFHLKFSFAVASS